MGAIAFAGLALASPGAAADDGHEATAETLESFDGTEIQINVCRPAGASASDPVPVLLHSHGWGGSKRACDSFTGFLDAGFGVVSMTQRGAGDSGGESHVMDPDYEGRDIVNVVDRIAELPWAAKQAPDDPLMGSFGGSYGGGFQWVGAFTDQALREGETRFDALDAGVTWHSLAQSLAPNGVVRSEIVAGLYAVGLQNNDMAPWVHQAMATSTATNRMLDGPSPADHRSNLHENGAAGFVDQGMQLDVPVVLRQGAADIVFPLNEAVHNYDRALTPDARADSILVGNQGGHGLPSQVPQGEPLAYETATGNPCASHPDHVGRLAWFQHTLRGQPLDVPSVFLGTIDGTCHAMEELPEPQQTAVDELDGEALTVGPHGQAELVPVLEGPVTLGGVPTLELTATTFHPDARLFWGLAVGPSEDEARLIDKQWMPTRLEGPAVGQTVSIELGGVIDEVGEDENVYLAVSPYAYQFAAHPSRVPGAVLVEDVQLGLPLVE